MDSNTNNSEQNLTLDQLSKNAAPKAVSVSSIAEANAQINSSGDDIHVEDFQVQEQAKKSEAINFTQSSNQTIYKDDPQLSYRKTFLRSMAVAIIALVLAALGRLYMQYTKLAISPNTDNQYAHYLQQTHKTIKTLASQIGISKYSDYLLSLVSPLASNNLQKIVNSSLSTLDKKFILQNELYTLIGDSIDNDDKLDAIKANTTAFGLLGESLYDVFAQAESNISVQRSLLSLETIKFVSALKVFANLDTFIVGFSDYAGYDPQYVHEQMQILANRNEQDIYVYLTHCYLNPYEVTTDCNTIDEISNYYKLNDPLNAFETDFFLKLMTYIDIKLEQTDVPSFAIVFQKLDPVKNEISFTISVNTFQQDETALINRGILNPHVFIVSTVINTLKQSRFVVGNNIDARQLIIQPKVVRVGSSQIVVNSSSMSFTLPIQQASMTEIYDFISG